MNFNDGTTKLDLNKTNTAVDASNVEGESDDPESKKIDQVAMEGARRATNRIHADEQEIPGSTLFTK